MLDGQDGRGPRSWARWTFGGAMLFLAAFGVAPVTGWAAVPTVAIVSPTAGSTVKGTVTVTAKASVGSGDHISSISIYDGVNSIASDSCQAQPSCTVSLTWKATGLSGQHSLTARATAGSGDQATSAAVVVNVESPPPAVAIVSPPARSTVVGAVTVSAATATDPSQDDYPTSVSFYDGVNSIGSVTCQGQRTCEGSVTWDATGLTGVHTLTARVRTNRGLLVTGPPVAVTVLDPAPVVAIVSPKRGAPLRRRIKVRVAGHTDPRQVDHPTSISVYDGESSIGSVTCQGQQTCAGSVRWDARRLRGRHKLTAIIRTRTGRTARSAAVIVGVAVKRAVTPSCRLSASTVGVRKPVRGRCKLSGVPVGTAAAVQYRAGRRWRTVLSGRVLRGGLFKFTLRGSKPATFNLWVRVRASSRTKAARGRIGTLRIR